MSTIADHRKVKTYLALALDPIHIGTGEFRLGRVDNTIVRDPATNLPKIPGSSLAGVARAYTAMLNGKYRRPGKNGDFASCAGKGGDDGMDHCGEITCPVCIGFGYSRKNDSFQGLAMFTDACVLFFPVWTVAGTVWVTSPLTLESAGYSLDCNAWNAALSATDSHTFWTPGADLPDPLNLGWIYLKKLTNPVKPLTFGLPASLGAIANRITIVSDRLLSHIVNDQLEVRTSVSINPETGAAQDKALFTAEAIPRGTVFFGQVSVQNPANFAINNTSPFTGKWDELGSKVFEGLKQTEHLGVGGLNTRGFGRLRIEEGSVSNAVA